MEMSEKELLSAIIDFYNQVKDIFSPFDELPLASTDFDEQHSTKIEIMSSNNRNVAEVITHYPEDINSNPIFTSGEGQFAEGFYCISSFRNLLICIFPELEKRFIVFYSNLQLAHLLIGFSPDVKAGGQLQFRGLPNNEEICIS